MAPEMMGWGMSPNNGYMPMFGANGGVQGYLSPQAEVQGLNAANRALPAYLQYNQGLLDQTQSRASQNFMRDFGNPSMAMVRAKNSQRSGDGMNSFAQQDNAFNQAEMARQASNVGLDARNAEIGRINQMRSGYFGTPTNDMDSVADDSYAAQLNAQKLAMQRTEDMYGRIGGFGKVLQNPYVANAVGNIAGDIGNFAGGVGGGIWKALFGGSQ